MADPRQSQLPTFALALWSMAALGGCEARHLPAEPAQNKVDVEPPAAPLPVAEPPLDRARLLLAVARAASARASGASDRTAQRELAGKQFEVRLRFGCDGQGPGSGDHGWSVDPDGRTLRLRAVPNVSMDDELVKSVAGERVEAAEGFWLGRPWMLDASCPVAATASSSAASGNGDRTADVPKGSATSAQRIGIAQFFTTEDPRTARRMNRPFEAVRPLREGERVGEEGFNLVLAGRLRARDDGRVILCMGSGRDQAPSCLISADIDRVWIERPEDLSVMAEWST